MTFYSERKDGKIHIHCVMSTHELEKLWKKCGCDMEEVAAYIQRRMDRHMALFMQEEEEDGR